MASLRSAFRKRWVALHDTPKSPHRVHGPKGKKHQGVGQAAAAGKFQSVGIKDGVKALRQAYKDNPRAWNLTPHSATDLKGARVFLAHDSKAGFVISADGELQNLFNNSGLKGVGAAGVKRAIEEGAHSLNAYDGFLIPFYEKLGFRETSRMKFDPKYAPANLPEDVATKQPDVVTMEYSPESKLNRALPLYNLIRKLEHRRLNRSLDDVIYKLEGNVLWTIDKMITCKGYDRNGQVVIECSS